MRVLLTTEITLLVQEITKPQTPVAGKAYQSHHCVTSGQALTYGHLPPQEARLDNFCADLLQPLAQSAQTATF